MALPAGTPAAGFTMLVAYNNLFEMQIDTVLHKLVT